MSTTNILDLNNRIDELEKNSGGGSADSAKRSDIATEFNTTTAYTAGCFVYHEEKLYQFNSDHSAGAWDPTDVVEANVTDQIVSNKAAIDGLTASDVAYDNTDSGLTATDVQGAVDEVVETLSAYVEVTNSGNETLSSMLDRLFAEVDITKITSKSTLVISETLFFSLGLKQSSIIRYAQASVSLSNTFSLTGVTMQASGSSACQSTTGATGATTFNVFSTRTTDTSVRLYY